MTQHRCQKKWIPLALFAQTGEGGGWGLGGFLCFWGACGLWGSVWQRVACDALRVDGDELRAHRLHLLPGGVAHIVGEDLSGK